MARRPNPYLIDDDNPALDARDFAAMKPAAGALPPSVYATLLAGEPKRQPGQRGPGKRPPKVSVTLRLEPETLDAFKAEGPGWQARMRTALRDGAPKARKRA